MNIKYSDLRDKIFGCWNGKNIGGVLGAPYEECQRSLHDVKFYQQDLNGNPPGNDDLDLQLCMAQRCRKAREKAQFAYSCRLLDGVHCAELVRIRNGKKKYKSRNASAAFGCCG